MAAVSAADLKVFFHVRGLHFATVHLEADIAVIADNATSLSPCHRTRKAFDSSVSATPQQRQ